MEWLLTIPVVLYSVIIFALWFSVRKKNDGQLPDIIPAIRVSVVVACRNEEPIITALLESLSAQDYLPGLLEIIIINDNSTDRTPVAVSEFISDDRLRLKLCFRLINNPFHGKKSAIRYGVEKSTGELILTTDADCTMDPRWVSAMASFYAFTGADMILAPVHQRAGRGFVQRFGAFEFAALQAVTEATARAGFPVMCNSANMGIRRETYLQHSRRLHDEIPSGDDMFLLHSVKGAGGDIRYYGNGAAVHTAAAVSAVALLRQRARWASKAGRYRDPATLILAAATAACHAAAAASLFVPSFLPLLATLIAIRLMPDYLLTRYALKKQKEHLPLPLFIIMDVLYPFWFVTVGLLSLFPRMKEFRR